MTQSIAIVGAGLAGLTAARALAAAGLDVTVFDKGRGLGGRLAGRRTKFGPFDHGAPVLSGDAPAFARFLSEASASGHAQHWPQGGGWIGMPTMNAPLRPLVEGFAIRQSVRVAALWKTAHWTLTDESDAVLGRFSHVVVTAPAPQARALVGGDSGLAAALDRVLFAPQWAAMLAWTDPPCHDFATLGPVGAIERVARMAAKPGREGPADRWVVHASPDWTRAHLDLPPERIAALLLEESARLLGETLPAPDHFAAHRWIYSRCETPLGAPYLASVDGSLLLGGDWALGSDAAHAFASGRAMAKAMIAALPPGSEAG